MLRGLAVAAVLLGLNVAGATALKAQTTYAYTGQDFTYVGSNGSGTSPYSLSDSVTGTFTLAAPLAANMSFEAVAPVSFSFSDGLDFITNLNGVAYNFDVSTNGLGQITGWEISMYSYSPVTDILSSLSILYNDPNYINSFGDGVEQVACTPGTYADGGCRFNSNYSDGGNSLVGAFTQNDVPEPATVGLMLTGLVCVGMATNRAGRSGKRN